MCIRDRAELGTHKAATVPTVQQNGEQRHIALGLAVGLGTVLIQSMNSTPPSALSMTLLVSGAVWPV